MNNKEAKEIDLLEILIKTILFIKRRFLLILIVLIAGTSLGFFKTYFEKKKYENKIIGNSDIIPNGVLYQIISNLSDDLKNNRNNFSAELCLTKEVSANINSIEIDTIFSSNKSTFEIRIQSIDSLSCEKTKSAINAYLMKNPFINQEYNFIISQKKQLITELNLKIKELDSLQKNVVVASTSNKNPLTIINSNYTEYISLIEKKQKIEKELQLQNKLYNIYFDYITITPFRPIKTLVFSFCISFIIGLIIAFTFEFFKNILFKMKNQ